MDNEVKGCVSTISLFIINNKGEMLLNRKIDDLLPAKHQWAVPCFVHDDKTKSSQEIAHKHLRAYGLECNLYEVFSIAVSSQTHSGSGEHIIIALTPESQNAALRNNLHRWAHINKILQETHDYPSHYVPWFRSALEGVVLYLKSYCKTDTTQEFSIQLEV
jgi:isopentenyldiphosphate isomerase